MAKRIAEKDYLNSLEAVVDHLFEVAADEFDWDWTDFAKEAGVSVSTVNNLGIRKTRFPEYRTIYLLAKAVNRVLSVSSITGKAYTKKVA